MRTIRKLFISFVMVALPGLSPLAAMHSYPDFSCIQANGRFNIHIISAPTSRFTIDQTEPCVTAEVRDGTLFLTTNITPQRQKAYDYKAANVTVWLPNLAELSLRGENSVTGDNVASEGLSITTGDNNYVVLDGTVDVQQIRANGNSSVSVQWVNSDELGVETDDNAHVYLAGRTNILHAHAYDDSSLNAKYLRSPVVLIDTEDNAVAEVLPTRSLYAFAIDNSNIYYFKSGKHLLESTQTSGNVLQLGHWK
jgi:hypothetical protein